MILQGLIHLLGFVVYLRLAEVEALSYSTILLSSKLDVGEAGANVFGIAWLVAAVGFVMAGVMVFALPPWWWILTFWVALLSLVVTVLGWPDSWFRGVNVVILSYLLVGTRIDWLP